MKKINIPDLVLIEKEKKTWLNAILALAQPVWGKVMNSSDMPNESELVSPPFVRKGHHTGRTGGTAGES